ncbi:MAG TPA: FtsX-like permease family protein [Burkholderiaceae bacterium]|nr:FtsX-like permease family protein [Burkholderiaceae bacterium]
MNLLELAWRNVLRNRRRTALTLAAVGVGAIAIVLLGGYVSAVVKAVQTDTVRQMGHLQIMAPGYLDFGRGNAARFAIQDYERLAQRLKNDAELAPLLAVVTPLLQVQGVAGHFASGNSSNFAGSGWVPADRRTMLAWDGYALGFPPSATRLRDDRPFDGVIGVGLAQLLDLCGALEIRKCAKAPAALAQAPADAPVMSADLGELVAQTRVDAKPAADGEVAIELLAASSGGAPNVVRMNVARAEQQGIRDLDLMYVSLPLALAQRLAFGQAAPGVSALVVQVKETASLPQAKARIETILRETGSTLDVHDFTVVSPTYNQIVALFSTMFRFVAILMGVVTLFSITNTVNMAVGERVTEIGTLRSIGLKRRHIRRMFVLEGGLIGLLGAALGMVLGLVIADYGINAAGLSWTPPGRSAPVPIGIDISGGLEIGVATVVVLTVIACFSSWWPARRAARLEIVEALRHV